MAVPAPFILRSYGGGAEAAQLVDPIGTTDTSFGITTTVGWTEADGSPLGTAGPFTVIIDRFTDTVEKITCSAVNLTTGVVTVDTTGGTGRGADGTNPQAHVPGGSSAGVQTCWTSVEAAEANEAAAYVLGSLGGTRTPGNLLALDGSGLPAWSAVAGIQSVSLFGVGSAAYGSPPARLTGAFLLQGGVIAPTFTSGFYGPFDFPEAFPNGTLGFITSVINATPSTAIQIQWESAGPASVELTASVNGSAYSGALQLFYLAIGF